MGLEPTTFCMAIVLTIRLNASFCGFRLNPITGDYRRFARYWSPNGPPASTSDATRHSVSVTRPRVEDARSAGEADTTSLAIRTPRTRPLRASRLYQSARRPVGEPNRQTPGSHRRPPVRVRLAPSAAPGEDDRVLESPRRVRRRVRWPMTGPVSVHHDPANALVENIRL
jgi:hypothetical protein